MTRVIAAVLLTVAMSAEAQDRMASDFEIAAMERQASEARDFTSQLSAHLNLGELRASRNELARSRAEYQTAFDLAERERARSRADGNLARYANATAYAGLSAARLGRSGVAFDDMDEALRYASDSSRVWNLDATAMSVGGFTRKAIAAERGAVAVALEDTRRSPTQANALDLAVYRFALARFLVDGDGSKTATTNEEAGRILIGLVDELNGSKFDSLRQDAARREQFEIYSSARGDVAAWLSVLNRSRLLLGKWYEARGNNRAAATQYRAALDARSDDPIALAALARLAASTDEREGYYADAFDANPFSIALIDAFEQFVRSSTAPFPEPTSRGARVRLAVQQLARGNNRAATDTLAPLREQNPDNDAVNFLAARAAIGSSDIDLAREIEARVQSIDLKHRIDDAITSAAFAPPRFLTGAPDITIRDPDAADLRAMVRLAAADRLTSEQRVQLDRLVFSSIAVFDAESAASQLAVPSTVLTSGTVAGIPMRFSEPMSFRGTFSPGQPLRLTYRILGATQTAGTDGLLLEPMKIEEPQ